MSTFYLCIFVAAFALLGVIIAVFITEAMDRFAIVDAKLVGLVARADATTLAVRGALINIDVAAKRLQERADSSWNILKCLREDLTELEDKMPKTKTKTVAKPTAYKGSRKGGK